MVSLAETVDQHGATAQAGRRIAAAVKRKDSSGYIEAIVPSTLNWCRAPTIRC